MNILFGSYFGWEEGIGLIKGKATLKRRLRLERVRKKWENLFEGEADG